MAHLGVSPATNYPEQRRVVLANQMAVLGGLLSVVYGVLACAYDAATFWPLIVATLPLLLAYAGVLWLDANGWFRTARAALIVLPAIQITFAAWLFSIQAGVQLHFFVLWTALFLLYTRNERWLAIGGAGLWIALYVWLQIQFKQPALPLPDHDTIVGLALLDFVLFANTVSAFGLTGATVALFYVEIQRTEQLLQHEYSRSQELLENILPTSVAERLKDGNAEVADSSGEVTLLFADLVGFTRLSDRLPPGEVVDLLNQIFSRFDRIVARHGLEKIKTIGDEYMLAGGLPLARPDHAQAVAGAALDMLSVIEGMNDRSEHRLALRVGIHTGDVVAGVIGSRKFSYDVWGDTVNTASRMQTHGLPGRIQVTEATANRLEADFDLRRRGTIRIRGKGRMPTWFLVGRRSTE